MENRKPKFRLTRLLEDSTGWPEAKDEPAETNPPRPLGSTLPPEDKYGRLEKPKYQRPNEYG